MTTTPADLQNYTGLYLGERILKLRGDRDLKQGALAIRMKLHPSIIGLWEYDERPVPWNRLKTLATALEVDISVLLRGVRVAPVYAVRDGVVPFAPEPIHPEAPIPAEDVPMVPLPPITLVKQELRWCGSSHGSGVQRDHHHGPVSSLRGLVVTIAEWA